MLNIRSKYDYTSIGINLGNKMVKKKKTCKKKKNITKGKKSHKKKRRTYKIIKFSSLLKKSI